MNCGASLIAIFFLLVVNLSFFTEVDSIVFPFRPSRPGRSVLNHEVIAKRHASAMDSIIAPPEKMRVVRGDYFYSP
ncbi:unnamed protein product [Meloidogyne enterolobii]|uniref:Uncharacterized protein n=1 Tax=Meloidogyne enterolobii TaxID=390850 RepID=A0ACB0ZFK5_MELEN